MAFLDWTGSIEFKKDGKDYTLSPLTLGDWGKFVSWVQYKPYRDALEADLPENKCEDIYEKCVSGKSTMVIQDEEVEVPLNLSSPEVKLAMMTEGGTEKITLLSLQINHPDIKTLRGFLSPEETTEIYERLMNMSGLEEEESEKN